MDALVGIRPARIVVELGAFEYTIPELPAASWIIALLREHGGSIVPGLLELADREAVWADFAAGEIDGDDIATAERDALASAAGRPWWEADRLIRNLTAKDNWPLLHGEMMLRGIRLEEVSLAAFLNAIYALILEYCGTDQERRARFTTSLSAIPAGVRAEDVYDEEDAAAEFLAAMAENQAMLG